MLLLPSGCGSHGTDLEQPFICFRCRNTPLVEEEEDEAEPEDAAEPSVRPEVSPDVSELASGAGSFQKQEALKEAIGWLRPFAAGLGDQGW